MGAERAGRGRRRAGHRQDGASGTDARTCYRNLSANPATWPGGREPPVAGFERRRTGRVRRRHRPGARLPHPEPDRADPGRYRPSAARLLRRTHRSTARSSRCSRWPRRKTRNGHAACPAGAARSRSRSSRQPAHRRRLDVHKAEGNPKALEAPAEAELTGAAMAALCARRRAKQRPGGRRRRRHSCRSTSKRRQRRVRAPNSAPTPTPTPGLSRGSTPAASPRSAPNSRPPGQDADRLPAHEQLAGGGFRFEPAETEANLYSTQDGLRAIAGAGFTAAARHAKGAPKWVFEKAFTPARQPTRSG